jgi:AmmeMemoRadiSam system protein A
MSGERDPSLGAALIATARGAIDGAFGRPVASVRAHPALDRPGATFVTLMLHGELRGCIGSLEARRALATDVRHNALAAAFGDPRFEPLARHEVEATSVEVSLLSAAAVVEVADEDDLLARLRPGVDGIVLELGARRATFLPQVWDALPDARDFLRALKRKAGMPADFWSGEIRVSRYTNTKWREDEFDAVPASAEASR